MRLESILGRGRVPGRPAARGAAGTGGARAGLGAAAVALALVVLPAGCDKTAADRAASAPSPEPAAPPPKPTEVRLTKDALEQNHVEASPAGKRLIVPTFPAPARVAFNAEAMAHVGAPVAGRVAELKVRLGDSVAAGAELLVVESPDLGEAQSDYLQKRTALAAASAAVEPVKIAYERGKTLFEQSQGIAQAEVQKREAEYKAARAAGQAASSAAAGAQNKLRLMGMGAAAVTELEETQALAPRYSIRTPIAGQLVQCDLTLGALVGPDKELQVEVADVGKVWVLADVPEAYYARLAKGAVARVRLSALPGRVFDGKVTLLAPALDASTRTLQARVEVANPDGLLRPGMLARAEIEAAPVGPGPAATVLAVPGDAVVSFEGVSIVFVPVEGQDGKFKKREVTLGEAADGWAPVLAGLKEGEKVVTRGAVILKAQLGKPAEEAE